jgi:site-specific DNA recombinase
MADLHERKIVTKVQALKSGKTIGGIPFTSGPLGYLLRNRFYVGEVVYKSEILPGEQVPIVDRELFEAVQTKLAEQQNNHTKTRAKSEALLTGLIFDDRGNRMTPSHARKKGMKYRYYVSLPLLQGQPDRVGSVHRVPASEIEKLVSDVLHHKFEVADDVDQHDLIKTHLYRVEVQSKQLLVELKAPTEKQTGKPKATAVRRRTVS